MDLRADLTALADRAAADGSNVISLAALYQTLGTSRPHHLHVRADGYRLDHGGCPLGCPIDAAVARSPLHTSPHAYGRTYRVWLDDEDRLRFRDLSTSDGSHDPRTQHGPDHVILRDGRHIRWADYADSDLTKGDARQRHGACVISRVGKKVAGRELDGRTWDEYPARAQ